MNDETVTSQEIRSEDKFELASENFYCCVA